MIIRKLLLIALVAIAGAQSLVHASDAPKVNAEKTESWASWYKRNRVLVGAASGAIILGSIATALKPSHLGTDEIVAVALGGSFWGALAGSYNVLAGSIVGGLGAGASAALVSPKGLRASNFVGFAIAGAFLGAFINYLHNSNQPKEDNPEQK